MRLRRMVASALLACQTACMPLTEHADLVVRNGTIYTVDPEQPWATALAVRDGKISFVGGEDGIASHIGASTRIIDAGARFIMPGFHDAHVHLSLTASKRRWCDLGYPSSLELTRERLFDCVQAAAGKPWVLAKNANTAVFPAAGPELSFWNFIAKEQPLYVDAVHSGFANSAAMNAAGVNATTTEPAGGVIVSDERGQPTGTFRETAKPLVEQHVPQPTEAEFESDFAAVTSRLPSFGIMSVQELTSMHTPAFFVAMQKQGKLPVRVHFGNILDPQTDAPTKEIVATLAAPAKIYNTARMKTGVIKIFVDGDIGDQTAALLAPYAASATSGEPLWKPEILNKWVAALDEAGLQIHFHAMGDKAVRMALDAVEYSQARNRRRDARHQITHLHIVSTEDLPRFKQLGVIANIQPSFATDIAFNTERILELVGPQRHATMFRFRDLLAAGAELAGSTDTPIVSPDALVTVETAVTRQEPDLPGSPFIPDQRLSRADAIKLATLGGARANRLDDISGSISIGKQADFILLDHNLFEVPERHIHKVRVLWTVIDGRDAYGSVTN